MPNIHELTFQPGFIVNQEFFDYATMKERVQNWLILSKYRFGTGPFHGYHTNIQLNNLEFGYADHYEGLMFEGLSPKDCLTIGILQKSSDKACVNTMKLEQGDMVIIDDSQPYNFVSSHRTLLILISIRKSLVATSIPWLLSATEKKFIDKDNILSDIIENEWRRVLEEPNLFDDPHELKVMEEKIVAAIKHTFAGQTGTGCYLTKGEKTAFEVRSFLLNSLERKMTIQSITEQFKVSDKTLQTSFKSLFGITPKRFIRLLKLNKTHEELQLANAQTINVSDIAKKWGFSHFGRFSKEYKEIFGLFPSETLLK